MVVAQEGVRRWFLHNGNTGAYQRFLESEQQRAEFNSLLKQTRNKLDNLYRESHKLELMRKKKQAIFQQMKADYTRLKHEWHNDNRDDAGMAQSINNAHLALVATYHELVPSMKAYMREVEGDLPEFYQQMEQLAKLPKAERHQNLMALVSRQNSLQLP